MAKQLLERDEVRKFAEDDLGRKPKKAAPKKSLLDEEPDEDEDEEYEDDDEPRASGDCLPKMRDVLGTLRAMSLAYQVSHWKAKGENFGSDHDLFGGFYADPQDESDAMAERMIGMYGNDAIDAVGIAERMHECLKSWGSDDPVEAGLKSEKELQAALTALVDSLEEKDELTLGLDNFLQGIADSSEQRQYKLKQRKG